MEKPYILHLFTPAAQASPFDVNMAYDAGFDAVVPYTGVSTGRRRGTHAGRDLLARTEGRAPHRHLHRRPRRRRGARHARCRARGDGAAVRSVGVRRSERRLHHRGRGRRSGRKAPEARARRRARRPARARARRYGPGGPRRRRARRSGGRARGTREPHQRGAGAGRGRAGAGALRLRRQAGVRERREPRCARWRKRRS